MPAKSTSASDAHGCSIASQPPSLPYDLLSEAQPTPASSVRRAGEKLPGSRLGLRAAPGAFSRYAAFSNCFRSNARRSREAFSGADTVLDWDVMVEAAT